MQQNIDHFVSGLSYSQTRIKETHTAGRKDFLSILLRVGKQFRLMRNRDVFARPFNENFKNRPYDFHEILQSFYTQRCSCARCGIKIVWLGSEKQAKLAQN